MSITSRKSLIIKNINNLINREWQRLTMDTIASCAFGIDANALTDNDSAFLDRCRRLFKDNETKAGIMKILIPLSCKYQQIGPIRSGIM